jgi:putative transcriptional regulator
MTIAHHLDDATLMRYACGDLDEAFLVVVASHLAMCDHCRMAVRKAEELGGELLDENKAAPIAPASFDALMDRLETAEAQDRPTPSATGAARLRSEIPAPLSRRVGQQLADVPWRTIAPGVKKHMIRTDPETRSALYMLWVAPGKAVPEHSHGGAELTLILSGVYRDEFGVFGPGDIADLDEHVEHQPHVEDGAPCICVVAAETPIRFKGIISKLLQPFIGI